MPAAPLPPDESERLRALHELKLLDSDPEAEFDALARAAALACGVPVSLISLVDSERQWFKANVGLEAVKQTPRDLAFCAHAIHGDAIFEVNDALVDPRFADNPLVTDAPGIRFYAAAPLQLTNGARIGTLCVIDHQPRQLDGHQREMLRLLAISAVKGFENRLAALLLARSEARFKTLSESAPLGVFETTVDGLCTYTNPRWQQIFGLDLEQSLGDRWSQPVHPDDRPRVIAEWTAAASAQREADIEFRVLRPDRSVRHVRSVSRPVIDSRGRVNAHIGSVEDVTERINAGKAIDQQHRRLASIIDGMGAGTWEWNVQTGETRFNQRWAEIIGFSLDELQPISIDTWLQAAHPDDLARSEAALQRHFGGESPFYELEARMRHRDGRWVWVLDRGRVLSWTADGKPEWMFGTHLDISERKEQENALRRSEQMLNRTGSAAGVGGWELDLLSGQLTWSEQTRQLHGVDADFEPTVEQAIAFYAPQARPLIEAAIEQAMVDAKGWDLELPFRRADGQAIWVRAIGHAEFEAGRPVRLIGAFQDVTEKLSQRRELEAANERFVLATTSGGIGVWDFDLAGRQLNWDRQTYALYGVDPSEAPPTFAQWRSWLHPDDLPLADARIAEAIAGTRSLDIEFRCRLPDGRLRHLRSAARVTRNDAGDPVRITGVAWDVTASRQLQRELAEQRELLQVTLGSIADAVITTNAQGQIDWLNPVAERMTGWTTAAGHGRPISDVFCLLDQQSREPLANPVESCLRDGVAVVGSPHSMLVARGGVEFGIDDSVAPIRGKQGELLGAVLVFRDVSEQRRHSREMRYRATHDALTKLVNRAEFEERLASCLRKVHADGRCCALVFIDLDHFKEVNDSCGHAAGDLLLQQVGELLGCAVRSRDTLARIGGDEFAVLLEHCSLEQAEQVAQKICDRMDQYRFVSDHHRFRIGTSIGVVMLDERWPTIETAMRAADQACYAAKRAGRNRVETWQDSGFAGPVLRLQRKLA